MAIYRARRVGARRMRKPMRKPRVTRKVYRTYKKSYKRIVTVKRTVQLATITNSTLDQNLVYQFKLSDLPNSTELTNLYDQYKIKSINLKIVPNYAVNTVGGGVSVPPVHSVLDFSDATALTGITDYMQYSTYKMTRGLSMHKRFLYPRQLEYALDQTTGTSALADVSNKWVRSESPNINHLGCKVLIPGSVGSPSFTYSVFATYYVLLKQNK